ncbi:hypothetical protein MLD38_027096 [Melastoma candidum]|uniref:Uncharacterized protein n=1 Tax=Melastoma candidum TaxID=119954 RepID=A0ACB9P3S2_9MYRT|nr:hypothetical protein MLD38_027096 [Melastoma candidum]
MASPAVRSLLGKSKIPLPLLISRTALTGQQQSVADLGTAMVSDPISFSPKEVVSCPPQSFVSIGEDGLLGGGKAWALGSEDGVRLAGHRPAVHDEDEDSEEAVDDDWDESGDDDDDLKDLDDSEDFDDDDDDSEDDEDVPRRKIK